MTDTDLDDCPEPWRSEINRLEADNERLRAALRRVEGLLDSTDAALSIAIREAKEALGDD